MVADGVVEFARRKAEGPEVRCGAGGSASLVLGGRPEAVLGAMLRNPRRHLVHGPLVVVVGPPAVHAAPRRPHALRQEVPDAA
eukprot:7452525-Lingulodinium_polyedra.AAC.1